MKRLAHANPKTSIMNFKSSTPEPETQIAAFSPSGRSSSSPDISTRTKTAKALGLDVPSALLVAVDEVIE